MLVFVFRFSSIFGSTSLLGRLPSTLQKKLTLQLIELTLGVQQFVLTHIYAE